MIAISDLVRRMAAAGAPAEAIAIAIEAIEQVQEILKIRRARNAERMRTVRAQSVHGARTQAAHARTLPPLDGPPSPDKEKSPTPPKEINPLPPLNPPQPYLGGRDATRPAVDEKFQEFRRSYPKRDGSNPWQPASKKFAAALRNGTEADQIIAGARRYADECSARQLVGTPMVAQAVTWLNQQRWTDYAPSAMNGHAPSQRAPPTAEELAKRRAMIEEGDRILREQQRHG